MKRINYIFLLLPILIVLFTGVVAAQDKEPETITVLRLRYFNNNNNVQYLILESLSKTGRFTTPLPNRECELYIDEQSKENLIGHVSTNDRGKAKLFIPPGFKSIWDELSMHTFIAVTMEGEEEITTELEITKSRIEMDTSSSDGVRTISVTVTMFEDSVWVPVEDVEIKVGIRRLGGILSAGEDETYITDESGNVEVEVNKSDMPGDEMGNFLLAARVDDHDMFGNLLVEKSVPWGVAVVGDDTFFEQRTLWSTRFRAPYWLLSMAYGIGISVWGVIIYLIFQLFRIKKLGLNKE